MKEPAIVLADGLHLPLQAVTETFAILAKRGAGKTYTANVLAEEMIGAGAQVVILDPLDAWWGLRSSANGQGEGLPVYVFGGEHGDLPLEAGAGELIADVVVDHGASVICSLRHLSKTKQRQFVTDFCERLYHRKGEPEHRTPLHVFIDEADAFVPQRVMADVARTVGAVDDIVRRGRSAGLGVTLISQRAAVVNKDVLTQCEVLIALRTISPQDRKALDAWVEAHDAHDQRQTFMETLASLEIGEAWVWSPGWLDVFERVRIRKRHTFDSSSTPKAGEKAVAPAARRDVDLDALRGRMTEVIERAEATDPRKLRARVRELEKQLAQLPAVAEVHVEQVEVPALSPEDHILLERLRSVVDTSGTVVVDALTEMVKVLSRLASLVASGQVAQVGTPLTTAPAPATPRRAAAATPMPVAVQVNGAASLSKAERAILTVLVQYPQGRTKTQLGLLAGYSPKGGGFNNALGRLRSHGLITGAGQEPIAAVDGAAEALGEFEPLPRGQALLDYWLAKLSKAERAVLTTLYVSHPQAMTKAELGEATGYEPSGGGFNNALGKLRTLELAEGYAQIKAAEVFFDV